MFPRGLAVLLTVTALTACGTNEDPAPRTTALPTAPSVTAAPDALLLRWRLTGGIAGVGGPGSLPDFSLYGDGRALAPVREDGVEVLREYRLTADALGRLLDGARAAGLDRNRTVSDPRVADAFTLAIRYGSARTRIQHPEGAADPAVRFWKRLSPEAWPAGDLAAPPRTYAPERLAVLTGEVVGGDRKARPWPLRPLGGGERAAGGRCTVLQGADTRRALELGTSTPAGTAWRSDGTVYSVRWRPLLPDETSCRTMAES
ncbi:hypothetical protein [Thermomonospora umbrina]|uniref:Lipoprotein n=1 Tax=Thermomonospora umbrina TaxID=111806 RepID=A0A3D9T4S6_9ACTN|nr:hypothetical protein [Thermomonospora umbrina]REE98811.1 hypothetical protein DFJ69_4309 [Thermomonospora umbrina]